MSFVRNMFCKECDMPVLKEITNYNCPKCGWRSLDQVYRK